MTCQKPHPTQLDLFNDSGAVVFANDAIAALRNFDAVHAAVFIQRIIAEEPEYHGLDALKTLCQAVQDWPFPSSTPMEITETVRRLEIEVQPAVETLMRGEAKSFMRPYWLYLAKAQGSQAYDSEFPQSFCASLYLLTGDYSSTVEAIESIPRWNENSDLVYWLCLARYPIGGIDACRSLLMRLAFLRSKRLPALIREIADPQIRKEWIAFKSEFDWLDAEGETTGAWFPAWQLLEHSDMKIASDAVPSLDVPPVQAFDLLSRLIKLEKRGLSPALVSLRSQLRDLDQNLFDVYMARRSTAQLK